MDVRTSKGIKSDVDQKVKHNFIRGQYKNLSKNCVSLLVMLTYILGLGPTSEVSQAENWAPQPATNIFTSFSKARFVSFNSENLC